MAGQSRDTWTDQAAHGYATSARTNARTASSAAVSATNRLAAAYREGIRGDDLAAMVATVDRCSIAALDAIKAADEAEAAAYAGDLWSARGHYHAVLSFVRAAICAMPEGCDKAPSRL